MRVTADAEGMVSHAGAELLRELAGFTGLIDAWDRVLIGTYKAVPIRYPAVWWPTSPSPRRMDRGLFASALRSAGYRVFAVNPFSALRYEDRHSSSGAKSDPGSRGSSRRLRAHRFPQPPRDRGRRRARRGGEDPCPGAPVHDLEPAAPDKLGALDTAGVQPGVPPAFGDDLDTKNVLLHAVSLSPPVTGLVGDRQADPMTGEELRSLRLQRSTT